MKTPMISTSLKSRPALTQATPMTLLLLGKFLAMSARFWLSLQDRYDLIEAQRTHPERLSSRAYVIKHFASL